jgi:predicted anti-sigma-YlaC factor YlaD
MPTIEPMSRHRRLARGRSAALLVLLLVLPSCSLRRMAIGAAAGALSVGGAGWASDDDPELVRDAAPFALKTIEGLLAQAPEDERLLLAAASGFTQYSFAFVAGEADYVEAEDLQRATALRHRALGLYRRALGYGLRGLEAGHPGFERALRADPAAALASMRRDDVPLLYWTGAAWGLLAGLAKHDAEVTTDLPLVAALMTRARELDPGFGGGAIHDFFIAWEGGRPAAGGGSASRARESFALAVAASGDRRVSPYVSLAETVSVAEQDRAEFVRLLDQALAVDVDAAPEFRLANLIAQRRAAWLRARADELFIE